KRAAAGRSLGPEPFRALPRPGAAGLRRVRIPPHLSRDRRPLRYRPLGVLFRRAERPHLLLRQALAGAARGPDGAVPDRPRPVPPAGADDVVHLRGSVAPPAAQERRERLPRRVSRGRAGAGLRLARRGIRAVEDTSRGGQPRARAEAGGEGDRQGYRGRRGASRPRRTGARGRRALRKRTGRSFPLRDRYPAAGRGRGGRSAQEPAQVVRAVLAGAAGRRCFRPVRAVPQGGRGVVMLSKWKLLALIAGFWFVADQVT